MPAMIGGFFRRGQATNVQQAHICSDHSLISENGLRLNNAVISNEVWLWGIAKWGKNSSSILYSCTLPECQEIRISLTKVNLRFKDGSTILNRLLDNGLKFSHIGKEITRSVSLLISPREYTITEEDLFINTGKKRLYNSLVRPDSLQSKRGNLVQKIGSFNYLCNAQKSYWGQLLIVWLSCTYSSSKRKPEINSQYGGKIIE